MIIKKKSCWKEGLTPKRRQLEIAYGDRGGAEGKSFPPPWWRTRMLFIYFQRVFFFLQTLWPMLSQWPTLRLKLYDYCTTIFTIGISILLLIISQYLIFWFSFYKGIELSFLFPMLSNQKQALDSHDKENLQRTKVSCKLDWRNSF
jgi:hypothetical protein